MANTNTTGIAYYNNPAYVALAGTAVQKIPWTFNTTPTFNNQTASSPSALQVILPPDLAVGGEFDGHPFKVRVCGKAQVVTTATVLVSIYNDVSMTATAGNIVASTGAGPSVTGGATAFCLFELEADILWDSSSLVLGGQQYGFVQTSGGTQTNVAGTSLTNAKTQAAGAVPAGFSIGITYSVGNTGSLVTISEFSVERV